jgi:hypothetical protein
MFIILNWSDYTYIGVVSEEDGTPMLFASHADAERYAEVNLNFNWKIIQL